MNHHGKTKNYEKYQKDSKTRTRQIQRVAWQLEIPWKSNNTTENLKKRESPVEPRWAKQQTKMLQPQPTKMNSFQLGPLKTLLNPTSLVTGKVTGPKNVFCIDYTSNGSPMKMLNRNNNKKFRSFKSKENIHKKEVGPYRGFGH